MRAQPRLRPAARILRREWHAGLPSLEGDEGSTILTMRTPQHRQTVQRQDLRQRSSALGRSATRAPLRHCQAINRGAYQLGRLSCQLCVPSIVLSSSTCSMDITDAISEALVARLR